MHGGAERRRAPLLPNVSPRAPRRFDPPSRAWRESEKELK